VRAEQSVRLAPAGRDTIRFTMMPEAREPVTVAPTSVTPDTAPVEESGRHIGPAFWVATGIGIGAVASGVTLGVLALKEDKDYNKPGHATIKKADRGDRHALFADISYGIAGAAAVTAIVLYFTSGKKSEEPAPDAQAWRVAPTFARDGGGLAAHTEF
jgi:hypothetical protein